MNPLRPNDTGQFSESDLIAFHFHELSPEQERTILRAMAINPSLAAESESIAASLVALKDVPMHVDDTILDRNWKALRPSLIPHARPLTRARRWRLPVFAGAAAAFAATMAFFVTPRLSAPPAGSQAVASTKPVLRADEALPHNQAHTNQQTCSNDTGSGLSSHPLVKAHLHTGLFRSDPSQPEAPIHLLSMAQTPSTPQRPPRLTPSPEPVEPNPPTPSTSDRAGLQPFGGSGAKDEEQGVAQGTAKEKQTAVKVHREHTLDAMLGIGGNFIVPQTGQTASRAITAVGALHQQFRPALGYRITASYARPEFGDSYPGNPRAGTIRINSRIYEVAGTYVIQGPHRGRFKTSVDAGAGLLAFLPSSVYQSTSSSIFRAAGVAGANLDVAFWKHWGARFAYRAQIFRSPNFVYTDAAAPVDAKVTVSNEPTLGITYTFGKQ